MEHIAIRNGNMMSGWGKGDDLGVKVVKGKRVDPSESGSDLKDVEGKGIGVIFVPRRRHNPERSVDHPEVWVVFRPGCARG